MYYITTVHEYDDGRKNRIQLALGSIGQMQAWAYKTTKHGMYVIVVEYIVFSVVNQWMSEWTTYM